MPTNLTVYPTLWSWRKDAQGKCQIVIRITQDGKSQYERIGQKIDPIYWNQEEKRVRPSHPNAGYINALITSKLDKLNSKMLQQELSGRKLDVQAVRNLYNDHDNQDVYAFIREKLKVWEGVRADGTMKHYHSDFGMLEEFRPELRFCEITPAFLYEFEHYLRNTRKNAHNTIWRKMKFIKMIYNLMKGPNDPSPFEHFKIPFKQTLRTFLTLEEVNEIEKQSLKPELHPTLRNVAHCFLLACYSGLRYKDGAEFKVSDIANNKIILQTQKTGEIISIPVHSRIKSLIDRSGGVFRFYSNQKMNEYVKIVAGLAKIEKNVTMHVARHTFAVISLELGIDLATIQKILGHRSIRTTQIYAKITDRKIEQDMSKWDGV